MIFIGEHMGLEKFSGRNQSMNLHLVHVAIGSGISGSFWQGGGALGVLLFSALGAIGGCQRAPAQSGAADESARKATEARAATAQELLKNLNFSLAEKDTERRATKADPNATQTKLWVQIKLHNNSGRPIHAAQGTAALTDQFGQKVATLGVEVSATDPLAPNDEWLAVLSAPFNPNDPADLKLHNTALKDLRVEWTPRNIIFADGSKLGEGGAFAPGVKMLYNEDVPPEQPEPEPAPEQGTP